MEVTFENLLQKMNGIKRDQAECAEVSIEIIDNFKKKYYEENLMLIRKNSRKFIIELLCNFCEVKSCQNFI